MFVSNLTSIAISTLLLIIVIVLSIIANKKPEHKPIIMFKTNVFLVKYSKQKYGLSYFIVCL